MKTLFGYNYIMSYIQGLIIFLVDTTKSIALEEVSLLPPAPYMKSRKYFSATYFRAILRQEVLVYMVLRNEKYPPPLYFIYTNNI